MQSADSDCNWNVHDWKPTNPDLIYHAVSSNCLQMPQQSDLYNWYPMYNVSPKYQWDNIIVAVQISEPPQRFHKVTHLKNRISSASSGMWVISPGVDMEEPSKELCRSDKAAPISSVSVKFMLVGPLPSTSDWGKPDWSWIWNCKEGKKKVKHS